MNSMNELPMNMTRVFVLFYQTNVFEFADFKDGLFQIGEYWYQPSDFKGWLSIKDLKTVLEVF
ncbi:MAG: hypothetical protein WC428_02015 [Candidatus Paceibacterota bacterium]